MRIRALVLVALSAVATTSVLSTAAGAQGVRRPRTDPRTPPQPAPLPPGAAAPVARDLAYKRSRWSAEAYSLVSSFQVPEGVGLSTRYTTLGAGTHGDYRFTNHLSATVDVTSSLFGEPASAQTAEVGTRFSPFSFEQHVRPFIDARAAFMRLYDTFGTVTQRGLPAGALNQQFADEQRYSRGFGGIGGAGFEFGLTRSLALTTEVSAVRSRMTAYRLDGPVNLPAGTTFWMTTFRYTLGIRFSPVRALQLAQNPKS